MILHFVVMQWGDHAHCSQVGAMRNDGTIRVRSLQVRMGEFQLLTRHPGVNPSTVSTEASEAKDGRELEVSEPADAGLIGMGLADVGWVG